MHSLQLPRFPPLHHNSFKKHRFDTDPSRFSLNLCLPKPISAPLWAALPSPPMSGSPPPERTTDQPQLAGRRRKRSDTPPAAAGGLEGATVTTPESPVLDRSFAHHRALPPTSAYGVQQATTTGSQPVSQAYGYHTQGPMLAAPAHLSLESRLVPGQLSPRATRRTKAHVASACVNCKKKHLRCDAARPCRRCISTGKEATCQDVEHKKRGRPPLKVEDSSARRSFERPLSPVAGPSSAASRMPPPDSSYYSQSRAYSYQRDIRPMQTGGMIDPGRPIARPIGPYQPMMVAPPVMTSAHASAGFSVPQGRPFSSGSSVMSSQPTSPESPYLTSPATGIMRSGMMQEIAPRSVPHYVSSYPQASTSRSHSSPYAAPSYDQQQSRPLLPPFAATPDLQLPPIQPAPRAAYDPVMAQQQRQYQQPSPAQYGGPSHAIGTTRQPDTKRPKMDIEKMLGPRND